MPVAGDHGILFELRAGADSDLVNRFGPPQDMEKIRSLNRRFEAVRQEFNVILRERGGDLRLGHKLARLLRCVEEFGQLPKEIQELILAAEVRQRQEAAHVATERQCESIRHVSKPL